MTGNIPWNWLGYCWTCGAGAGDPCIDKRDKSGSNHPRYILNPHPKRPKR